MSLPRDVLSGETFDPETTTLLEDAYARALRHLHDKGQPDSVLEVIARQIIRLAKDGERDPDVLARRALVSLGLKHHD